MAPHLKNDELDFITKQVAWRKTATDIHAELARRRLKDKLDPPKIWAVRRAMRGSTHKRGRVETRGRSKKVTPSQAKRLEKCRVKLIQEAAGEYEVTYPMLLQAAKLSVHRTTASRSLGPQVRWRRLREKPPRTEAHEDTRRTVCARWRRKPKSFWTDTVDLIIDNKKFPIPTTLKAKKRLRSQRVRGVHRTRKEGLKKAFTKPSARKHKFNPGSSVSILAGICGDRIVLWEEVPGRWTGAAAAAMYEGPIKKTLQKHRPHKRSWAIMEDNDPAGYKSGKGKDAKRKHTMRTLDQPPYSPDLNPLDFCIWDKIAKDALELWTSATSAPDDYKALLRRVATRMPRPVVRKAVESIKARAAAIFEADGGNIKRD